MNDDDEIVIDLRVEVKKTLDDLNASIAASMQKAARAIENSLVAAMEKFGTVVEEAMRDAKTAGDNTSRIYDKVKDSAREAGAASGDIGDQSTKSANDAKKAWAPYNELLDRITARIDLLDRSMRDMAQTDIAKRLGGPATYGAIGAALADAERAFRDLRQAASSVEELGPLEARLRVTDVVESVRKANTMFRVFEDTLNNAVKIEQMASRERIQARSAEMKAADAANRKTLLDTRIAGQQQIALDRAVLAEMQDNRRAAQQAQRTADQAAARVQVSQGQAAARVYYQNAKAALDQQLSDRKAFNAQETATVRAQQAVLAAQGKAAADQQTAAFRAAYSQQTAVKKGMIAQDVDNVRTGNRLVISETNAANAIRVREAAATQSRLNMVTQQGLQRELIAEKAGYQQSLQELKNAGRVEAQEARAAAEIRIQIARTAAKTILGIQRAATSATAALLRGVGSSLTGMVSRWRSSEREMTSVTQQESGRRLGIFRSSLKSQETVLMQSVRRQERITQSLQAQTSKGVLGAATGKGMGGGMFAGLAGGAAVIAGLRAGMNEISNVAEQSSKVSVLFGDASETMIEWSKSSVEAMALTQGTALEAAGNFGALLKGAGMVQDDAAMAGMALTQLAADMASFNNTSVEDALQAIRSGLSGESEPLRRFNVFLSDATLKTKALELGLYSGKGTLDQYAKSQATLALLFDSTSDAQGDLARTADSYSNRLKFQKAQLVQFWAAISKPLTEVASIIMGVTVPAMEFMTKFVKNEVGPALQMLRTALIGVAAGMGALIAMKGAVEVLKLLGTTAKLALTPFGALLAAFGLIGAAVGVLWKHSEQFRETMRSTLEVIKGLFGSVFEGVGTGIDAAKNGFDSFVQTLDRIGGVIGGFVLNAVTTFANVLQTVVIPAVKAVWHFLEDNFLPAAQAVGSYLGEKLRPVFDVVAAAFSRVRDVVQALLAPLATAFRQIRNTVDLLRVGFLTPMEALKGILSSLGRGFAGVFSNIARVVRNVASEIGERLRSVFSRENMEKLAMGALALVHQIGYILGNIVSDPRFLRALSAIALAAATVVAAFVTGVGRGVIENIPELASMLYEALKDALGFALSNPGLIALVIGGGLLLKTIVTGFRTLGSQAAQSFAGGFGTAAKTYLGNSVQFGRALFGGIDAALDSQIRKMESQRAKMISLFASLNRDIERLGGQRLRIPTNQINDATLAQAQERLAQLKTDMGQSASAAVLLKARLAAVGTTFTDIFRGGMSRQSISQNLRVFGDTVKSTFTDMSRDLQAKGYTVGQTIGMSVSAGIGAAMSGYAGGSSGTTSGMVAGLGGVLASSLAIGAVNPAAGAAVGAVGLLSTAIGAAGASAKKAAAELDTWVNALENSATAAEIASNATSQFTAELKKEQPETIAFFKELSETSGVSLGDLAEAMSKGKVATRDALESMFKDFKDLDDIRDPLTGITTSWQEMYDQILDGKSSQGTNELAKAFGNVATQMGYTDEEAGGLIEALDYLDDEMGDAFSALEINQMTRAAMDVNEELGKTAAAASGMGLDRVFRDARTKADEARGALELAKSALSEFLNPDGGSLAQQIRDATLFIGQLTSQEFDPIGTAIGNAQRGNEVAAFATQINEALSTAVEEGVTSAADLNAYVLQPLRDQLAQTPMDAGLKEQLLKEIDGAIADPKKLQAIIDDINVETAKAKAQEEIQAFFDSNPILTDVQGSLSESERKFLIKNFEDIEPEIKAKLKGVEDDPVKKAQIVKEVIGNLKDEFDKPDSKVKLPTGFLEANEVYDDSATIGSNIANGIADGIDNASAEVTAAVKRLSEDVKGTLTFTFDMRSPSRVTAKMGGDIAKGMAIGIRKGTESVNRASREMALGALRAMGGSRKATGSASQSMMTAADRANIFGSAFDGSAGKRPEVLENYFESFQAMRRTMEGRDSKSVSLGAGSEMGRENRQTLREAAKAAADLATTEIARGGGVNATLKSFQKNLKAIQNEFVSLGFSASEVSDMLDQFGYGADDLKRFRKELKEAERATSRQRRRTFEGTPMQNVLAAEFGAQLGEAFNKATGAGDATFSSIVSDVMSFATTAIENRGTPEQRNQRAMAEIASQLFSQVIGSNGAFGRQGAGLVDARASYTLALSQALGSSAGMVSELADIRAKKARGERLTAEERDMLGESAFSLDLKDTTGARNAQMLSGVVEAAAEVARAQLAAGQDPTKVSKQFQKELDSITKRFKKLGFAEKDIEAFLDAMGYSEEALQSFAESLEDAENAAGGGAGGGGAVTELPAPKIVTNNIYLPYGDPEAVALAVANRQAVSVL